MFAVVHLKRTVRDLYEYTMVVGSTGCLQRTRGEDTHLPAGALSPSLIRADGSGLGRRLVARGAARPIRGRRLGGRR